MNALDLIQTDRIVDLIEQMVAIESVSGNEHAMADWVTAFLNQLNPDELHRLPVEESGDSVAAVFNKDGTGPAMLLNFHLDTFPEFAGWQTPAFQVQRQGDLSLIHI